MHILTISLHPNHTPLRPMRKEVIVPMPVQQKSDLRFTYPALIESPLILCVDDDPAILELLEDVLTACGLRAICTSDCSTAIHLLSSEPIDLVVLDYQMPQMDGLTLAQKIRHGNCTLPMILFSGALLPCEAVDIVSRIIRKGEGALTLADAVLETLSDSAA